MRANYFRSFGVLTLLADVVLFFGAIEAVSNISSTPWPSVRILLLFTAVTGIGFGLLSLRRWAAIYFSLPLFVIGIWVFWTSIEQVPFPCNLLWMCEGLSLMLPLIVTILIWRELTSGGKWFF